MELIQECNIFEFNQDLWIHLVGVAMGIHPAPSYANIHMARRIHTKIVELGKNMDQMNNWPGYKIQSNFYTLP